MADYSLVVGSKFSPFTYQEMLAPVLMATQAHQDLENQYGELATKANIWDEMANAQTDPYAYKMYKNYANDLANQAEQLAQNGLNASSRKSLLNMKARYSKEITPIEQAYASRQKQAEQQQQALLQDPTLMLSRRASTTSLDDYIRNPQLSYESYSGKLLTAQTAQAASALAKEMQDNPRKWRGILGNSYYETVMQKGFSSDAVLKAIANNPEAAPQLTKIVEDTIGSSGIKNWADEDISNRAYDYAKQGLWSAVGETQYQTLDNWRAKLAAEEESKKRIAAYEHSLTSSQNQGNINSLAINPLNIYSSRELSKDEKKYKDDMKRYSKYFYKDNHGQMRMTWAGWQEYTRNATPTAGSSKGTARLRQNGSKKFTPTAFRQFMDNLGANKVTGGKWQPGNLGNVWNRYVNNSPAARTSRYDATRVTEYDYPIASAQQGDMKDAIMTAGRGSTLKEVDYDSKSKSFKVTGHELSMNDLKEDKYKVTATRFSPYGSTVMIQDDKGNVKRYKLPSGINSTNEANRDRAMQAAVKWRDVVNNGTYTDAKGKVHRATPDEVTYAQQQYSQALQEAYLYHSQLGVSNKTKEQEFNPYGY